MTDDKILTQVFKLYNMYKKGILGGLILPEDSNPGLPKSSADNYHYFTLPMALNYQRNSFSLWESALKTYLDYDTAAVFNPEQVFNMKDEELLNRLICHKLAIQPFKQAQIWRTISKTIYEGFNGDIRNLFIENQWHIPYIMEFIQKKNKNKFPYLSGLKLCSYWLHVMERYTDAAFTGREFLSVAPDTHVIKATARLRIIDSEALNRSDVQQLTIDAWNRLLSGTELNPIDMHTPLWLWSRSGFMNIAD